MIPTRLLSHSVDLIQMSQGGADPRYGTPTVTETFRETVAGRMEKQAGAEDDAMESTVVNLWRLIINDPGYVLKSYDRVEYAGTHFEVLGTPAILTTPRGVHHHEYDVREVQT